MQGTATVVDYSAVARVVKGIYLGAELSEKAGCHVGYSAVCTVKHDFDVFEVADKVLESVVVCVHEFRSGRFRTLFLFYDDVFVGDVRFNFKLLDFSELSAVVVEYLNSVIFSRIVRSTYDYSVVCPYMRCDIGYGRGGGHADVDDVCACVGYTLYKLFGDSLAAHTGISAQYDLAAACGIAEIISREICNLVGEVLSVNAANAVRSEKLFVENVFVVGAAVFFDCFVASANAHTVFGKVNGNGSACRNVGVVLNSDGSYDIAVAADKHAVSDGGAVLVLAVIVYEYRAAADVALIADIDVADIGEVRHFGVDAYV